MSSSESDDWNWNPTFVTPDGEPVEIDRNEVVYGYRDADTLEELYHGQELTVEEVAEELGTAETTIRRWMRHHGIETRDGGVQPGHQYNREAYETAYQPRDPLEHTDDPGPFECPDCGEAYETRAEESACIAQHARQIADSSPGVFG